MHELSVRMERVSCRFAKKKRLNLVHPASATNLFLNCTLDCLDSVFGIATADLKPSCYVFQPIFFLFLDFFKMGPPEKSVIITFNKAKYNLDKVKTKHTNYGPNKCSCNVQDIWGLQGGLKGHCYML